MTQRRTARRSLTAALAVVLMLVLSGCFDMRGQIAIDGDGRISGTQRIEIKKETATGFGIMNLDMFRIMVESGGEGGMFGVTPTTSPDESTDCPGGLSFDENDTAYAATCTYENYTPTAADDEMFSISRVGDTIELTFTNSGDDTDMAGQMFGDAIAGSVDVTFDFPGAIQSVDGATAAKATKVDDDTIRIQGTLMESYDIKVVSGTSGGTNTAPDTSGGVGGVPGPDAGAGGDDVTGGDDAATGGDTTTAASDDDGGSNLGLILGGVLVLLVLVAVVVFVVLRGRGKNQAAQPAMAGAGYPATGAPGVATAQPTAPQQAVPQQTAPQPAQQQAPQQAPPGWYPVPGDPSGQQRYWDGTSWSNPPQQ